MLLIGILLVVVVVGVSLFSSNNGEKTMNDFCAVECKQDIQKKYKFCC